MQGEIDLGIGGLEFVLGTVVLAHLWRFRRGFPWLVALTGFFFLRSVDRISLGAFGTAPTFLGNLLDPLIVVVLVLLVFTIDRLARGLEYAEDAALLREREYRRALADYRRLARHRLATPVTAILCSARMLLELEPSQAQRRAEMAEILEEAVVRLEHVSLDPRSTLQPDERSLKPSPFLGLDP